MRSLEEIVAANIKRYRIALDLSKNRCAILSGSTWQNWDWWEREVRSPSMRKLAEIAKALKCEPADLLKDSPDL